MCSGIYMCIHTPIQRVIGVGRQFEVGVLNRPVAKKGVGRRTAVGFTGTDYISARGNSASSSLKSGGAKAPTAPTVPTPMRVT